MRFRTAVDPTACCSIVGDIYMCQTASHVALIIGLEVGAFNLVGQRHSPLVET